MNNMDDFENQSSTDIAKTLWDKTTDTQLIVSDSDVLLDLVEVLASNPTLKRGFDILFERAVDNLGS